MINENLRAFFDAAAWQHLSINNKFQRAITQEEIILDGKNCRWILSVPQIFIESSEVALLANDVHLVGKNYLILNPNEPVLCSDGYRFMQLENPLDEAMPMREKVIYIYTSNQRIYAQCLIDSKKVILDVTNDLEDDSHTILNNLLQYQALSLSVKIHIARLLACPIELMLYPYIEGATPSHAEHKRFLLHMYQTKGILLLNGAESRHLVKNDDRFLFRDPSHVFDRRSVPSLNYFKQTDVWDNYLRYWKKLSTLDENHKEIVKILAGLYTLDSHFDWENIPKNFFRTDILSILSDFTQYEMVFDFSFLAFLCNIFQYCEAQAFSKTLITTEFIVQHQAICKTNPALFEPNLKRYLEIEEMRLLVSQYCDVHGFSKKLVTDNFIERHYATWMGDSLNFENNLKSYLQIEAMTHAHLTPLFDAPFFMENDAMIDSTTDKDYIFSEPTMHARQSQNLSDSTSNNQNDSPRSYTTSEDDTTDDIMMDDSTTQSVEFLLFSTEQLATDSVLANASLFAKNPKKRPIGDVIYEENRVTI